MSADAIVREADLDKRITVSVRCYACSKELYGMPARHACPGRNAERDKERGYVRLAIEFSEGVQD